jgi:Glycosyl hydrolase family 71
MSHRRFILAAVPVLVLAAIFGLAGIPAASATTTSVSTAVDSFLSQRAPDRTYGDSRHIRTCPATCEGVGSSERSVLVQFSVSAIPAGASGVTAKMELTPWTNSSGTVSAHAITSSWSEASVTWDTRPSYGPAIASKTLNSTSQATTWDVSSLIQKNGTYGIMLKQSTGNQIDFRSSEASTGKPRLLITYSVTTTSTSTSTPTPTSTTTTAASTSTTTTAAPTTNGPLPFAMPTKTTLLQSGKKVFAHYFTPYPISLDNTTADLDYYTRNYLNPDGESGKFAACGGLLRDRPPPQAPIATDWQLANLKTEVAQASAAGLDGFILDLLSISSTNWARSKMLLTAAEQTDPTFKIILMPDTTTLSLDEKTLAAALAELGRSPAAYRLSDGRLVVSPFYAEGESVTYWANVIATLKNSYGLNVAFVPTFLNFRSYASAFAPISYGFSNWGSRSPARNTATSIQSNIDLAHSMGKIWMQPVSVQDERPKQGLYDEANNTENLRATWTGAINGADWVQMVTWNDYSEGTQFAPSQRNNSTYLDLSSYYLVKFKTGAFPKITKDVVYVTHRMQRYASLPTYPQTKLMQLRSGSSPARNEIEVLTMLTAAATVTATIGGVQSTYDAPSGVHSGLFDLRNGQHSASVRRDGSTTASVTTNYTVVDRPYVQDLQYYAVNSGRG